MVSDSKRYTWRLVIRLAVCIALVSAVLANTALRNQTRSKECLRIASFQYALLTYLKFKENPYADLLDPERCSSVTKNLAQAVKRLNIQNRNAVLTPVGNAQTIVGEKHTFDSESQLVSHLNWSSVSNHTLTFTDASPTLTSDVCEELGWQLITKEQGLEVGFESIGIGALAFVATVWALDMLQLLWGFGLERIRDISRAVQGRPDQ